MKFDLMTKMPVLTDILEDGLKDNDAFKLKPVMMECYPDDWCRPESGTGCCPGPAGCWPTLCTPDR